MKALSASAIVLIAHLAANVPAQALTRHVDGGAGADSGNNCTVPTSPCASIGHAIDQAGDGDTIAIANGTYTESVRIDKSLVLQGESQHGTIVQAHVQPGQAQRRVITADFNLPGQYELAIHDLTIRHGVAQGEDADGTTRGGGLYLSRPAAASTVTTLTLAHVSFRDNIVQGLNGDIRGGGLYTVGTGTNPPDAAQVDLLEVSFIGNQALLVGTSGTAAGGGYYATTHFTELRNVVFRDNHADWSGGGMQINAHGMPSARLTNMLFHGNSAGQVGGGLANGSHAPILTNVTLSGNSATSGGGIYALGGGGPITLHNSIVWGNTATGSNPHGHQIHHNNTPVVVRYSTYGNGAGDITGSAAFTVDNSLVSDPLFRDPARGDLRLFGHSGAIDAGDTATDLGLFPVDSHDVAVDLDGLPRVFDGRIDMGAYERTDVIFRNGFDD